MLPSLPWPSQCGSWDQFTRGSSARGFALRLYYFGKTQRNSRLIHYCHGQHHKGRYGVGYMRRLGFKLHARPFPYTLFPPGILLCEFDTNIHPVSRKSRLFAPHIRDRISSHHHTSSASAVDLYIFASSVFFGEGFKK